MKSGILLSIIALALLPSCGKPSTEGQSTAKPSTTQPKTQEQRFELETALRKFDTDPRVYENPLVLAAQEQMTAAYNAFVKARSEHPALKAIIEEGSRLQKEAVDARVAGDDARSKKAMSEYSSHRIKLEQESRNLADLKPLLEASVVAEKAWVRAKHESMKAIPEAAPIVAKLEALK
jgi:hypothetical protein